MSSVSIIYINIYHCKINFVQLNSYENLFDTKISIMKIIHLNKKLITVAEIVVDHINLSKL